MASKKLFGGLNLGEVASSVKERASPSPLERGVGRSVLPAAELALTGRTVPALERENVYAVDPKRCRPWAHHNRSAHWYTRERCAELIDSMQRDGQLEPVLARRLHGDPDFDYELIFGMRRRYAAEVAGLKLKLRVVEVDDAKAAVLMHIENADRQDITPMERALSFAAHVEAKLFATQEALAEAFGVSKAQVAKMVRAAELVQHATLSRLFPDRAAVPIEPAYKLAAMMEKPGAKEVVLQAAQALARKIEKGETPPREPSAVLRMLLGSLDRSRTFPPLKRQYNVGASGRAIVTRNFKGKVTFAFPQGVGAADREAVLSAVDQALKDLG